MSGVRDPAQWFDGHGRVMFVHAHPDDETIATGGTLAALAEVGLEPLLVTLSRGEQGEVTPGPLRALVEQHGIAVVRQNELKTALGMLAATPEIRHAFLGVPPARAEGLEPTIYEDSGMAWGEDGRATSAPEATPDALTSVPATEPLYDLLAAAYLSGATAIVSYDDGGGYGHPDHVLAHRLARAVATALEIPFWEILSDPAPGIGSVTESHIPGLATHAQDDDVEVHDVTPWMDRKLAALRAHATQLSVDATNDGHDIVHVGGQREPVMSIELFRKVVT